MALRAIKIATRSPARELEEAKTKWFEQLCLSDALSCNPCLLLVFDVNQDDNDR